MTVNGKVIIYNAYYQKSYFRVIPPSFPVLLISYIHGPQTDRLRFSRNSVGL